MRINAKLFHQTQTAMGTVKRLLGGASANPRMQREGRRDQTSANMRRVGDNLRAAFKR